MTKKPTIVVPVWAGKANEAFWGSNDYVTYNDGCSSTWISLRVKRNASDWVSDIGRTYQDIGVYVWIDADGCTNIDIRAHDVSSNTIADLERLVKTMKQLRAKAAKKFELDQFIRDKDIHTQLTRFFAALGIKDSVIYTPGSYCREEDRYQPISVTIKHISDALESRRANLKRRSAA